MNIRIQSWRCWQLVATTGSRLWSFATRCSPRVLYAGGIFLVSLLLLSMPATAQEGLGPDPLGVAKSLEDYASLLRKMNRETEAAKMEARAKAIRTKHARENQQKEPPTTGLGSPSTGVFTKRPPKAGSLPLPVNKPAHPGHKSGVSLAEKATDPSAVLMQLQMQYITNHIPDDDADNGRFVLQPVIPITKSNVARLTMPLLDFSVEPNRKYGLGDFVLLDFQLFQTPSSTFGTGPAISIPTATNDALGSGKLSIGPNFLWIYHGIKKFTGGVLMEQLWSVAGDSSRANVSEFLWQPIVTFHFPRGYYLSWSSQQAVYDLKNKVTSIPLGVVLGKVFLEPKLPWNISVEPYYTYNSNSLPDEWGLKFQFTAIFPKFHW